MVKIFSARIPNLPEDGREGEKPPLFSHGSMGLEREAVKQESICVTHCLSPDPVDRFRNSLQGNSEQDRAVDRFSTREKLPGDVVDFFVDFLCREKQIVMKDILNRIEKGIISKALRAAQGNQRRAARILGIKYTTLNVKIKKHQIKILRVPSI